MFLARFPVAGFVHEGPPFHGADTQAADDDVDVDVPGTVVTVRVGADDGWMTGEVVLAELQAKGLRPLHGQAVLYCVLSLLLSSTKIILCGCTVNNQKQILED